MLIRLSLLAGAMLAMLAPSAHALTNFGSSDVGFNGSVNDIEVADGIAYVTGDFDKAGTVTGGAARLDGLTGAIDTSQPVFDARFWASADDGAGGYFAGGEFTHADGLVRNRFVHVLADGTIDPAFAPSFDGPVRDFVFDGTNLYVGGSFATVNGTPRANLAALNAATGALLAWDPAADNGVYGVELSTPGSVYVSGEFTTVAGQSRGGIAELNSSGVGTATAWAPMAAGGGVRVMDVTAGHVWVGGLFTSIGGEARNRIAQLDRTTALATPWNPSASADVVALVVRGSTVYAGGSFTTIGGQARGRLAALDATTGMATAWNPTPGNGVESLDLSASGDTIYAGGGFITVGGSPAPYVAAIDTATGLLVPSFAASTNGNLTDVEVMPDGDVVIGGIHTLGSLVPRSRLAAIDLATGQLLPWNPSANSGVNAITVVGSSAYIGGSFTTVNGQTRNRVAEVSVLTGSETAWNPNANNTIYDIEIDGSTVYAGGSFTTIGGQSRNRIAAISIATGSATPWDPNASGLVSEMLVAPGGSTLYIGGNFTTVGGQTRNYIAELDTTTGLATAWNPNANSLVSAFWLEGASLFVGGSFTTIGGASRNRLAQLDTATGLAGSWNPDANSSVEGLQMWGDTLYAAGSFTTIGGSARLGAGAVSATDGTLTGWNPAPGPFVRSLGLTGDALLMGGGFSVVDGRPQSSFASFAADVTPDAFTFPTITNAVLGGEQISDPVTITGVDPGTAISVTGGTYSVNGGTNTAAGGTLEGGETIRVQHTASIANSTTVTTTLTVGTVSQAFSSTTLADAIAPVAPIVTRVGDTFNFLFTGEVGATFACAVDGGTYTPCTSPFTAPSNLGAGAHELRVTQRDGAGNVSVAGTATYAITAPPAAEPPKADPPTIGSLGFAVMGRVRALAKGSTKRGVTATCTLTGTAVVQRCTVKIYADDKTFGTRALIGTGTRDYTKGPSTGAVSVALNATGLRLTSRYGVVPVRVVASALTNASAEPSTATGPGRVQAPLTMISPIQSFIGAGAAPTPALSRWAATIDPRLLTANQIVVTGFTESTYSAADNRRIGRARAATASRLLRRLGYRGQVRLAHGTTRSGSGKRVRVMVVR